MGQKSWDWACAGCRFTIVLKNQLNKHQVPKRPRGTDRLCNPSRSDDLSEPTFPLLEKVTCEGSGWEAVDK